MPLSVASRIREALEERRRERFRLLLDDIQEGRCSVEQAIAVLSPEERRYLSTVAEERGLWPEGYEGRRSL